MPRDIFDAVYGSVMGGAIGDALGAPVEGWYWHEIRQKYGRVETFVEGRIGNAPDGPGGITDDTTLAHYITLAILRKGGRITPDDLAAVWLEKGDNKRFWTNERLIRLRLDAGMNPWDAGKGAIPAGCATMAIGPIGIINAGNPAQAYQDAFNIAFVNQDDLNRDGAATLAAGVAAAFTPGATVESVVAAMEEHASYVYRRAFVLVKDLVAKSHSVDEFAAAYYERMLDWAWPRREWRKDHFYSGSSVEIVPVVLALLLLCQGEPNACIIEGASFGRDCDTIGRAIGSVVGALHGASALRQEWIAQVERVNAPFFLELEGDANANFSSIAQRLVGALQSELAATRQREDQLSRILG
jgi:ADP-ribosylglycohydrolase